MAKKDTVYIDIQTSDGGSMQRVAVSAKKLGLALDDVGVASGKAGKGSSNLDRNMKGLSKQSSNSTKNFSKMAQGMTGTLVPAYAVLAANVFAITAAFNFLKKAADMRVMQESQVAFTGATGVGMQSLTADIQAASGSMLDFQASSEAASIGIASGLGAGQIEELAAGAANLSKILGRDTTDSFNRLIRGVTKAEPELLDELGITLRLADAQSKYAATLGKTAQDLSMYEKKQAVFVEVQGQLETKYNGVAKATDVQANKIAKLGVAFDKVLKVLKGWIAVIAEPVAEFFTKNVVSLTAALALMAVPIIKAIVPGLNEWGKKSKENAEEASKAYREAKEELEELEQQQKDIASGKSTTAGIKNPSKGLVDAGGDISKLKKNEAAALLRHAHDKNKKLAHMDKKQLSTYRIHLKAKVRGSYTATEKIVLYWRSMGQRMDVQNKKMVARWKAAMAMMQATAAKFTRGVDLLMKGMGLIGIILMVKDLGTQVLQMMGFFKEDKHMQDVINKFKEMNDGLVTANKEYKDFVQIQEDTRKEREKSSEVERDRLHELKIEGKMIENLGQKISEASNKMKSWKKDLKDARAEVAMLTPAQARLVEMLDRMERKSQNPRSGGGANRGRWVSNGLSKKEIDELTASYGDLHKAGVAISGIKALSAATMPEVKATNALSEGIKQLSKEQQKAAGIMSAYYGSFRTAELTIHQTRYKELLDQIVDGTFKVEESGKEFDDLTARLSKTGATAAGSMEAWSALSQQYLEVENGLTTFKTTHSDLIEQIVADRQALLDLGFTKDKGMEGAKITEYTAQLKLLRELTRQEVEYATQKLRNEKSLLAASIGKASGEKAYLNIRRQILDNDVEINKLQALEEAMRLKGIKMTPTMLAHRNEEVKILELQNRALERQLDIRTSLVDAARQGLETGLSTNIAAILKGEESSIKDALLNIMKSVVDSMIDAFAKNVTNKIMSWLNFETEEERMKRNVAEGAKKGVEDAAPTVKTETEAGIEAGSVKFVQAFDEAATRFATAIREACSSCCMGCSGGGGGGSYSGGGSQSLNTGNPPWINDGLPFDSNNVFDSNKVYGSGLTVGSGFSNPGGGDLSGSAGHMNAFGDPMEGGMMDSIPIQANSVTVTTGVAAAGAGGGEGENGAGGGTIDAGQTDKPGGGKGGSEGLEKTMGELKVEAGKMALGLGLAVTALLGNSKVAQALQKIIAIMYIWDKGKLLWEKLKDIRDKALAAAEETSRAALITALYASATVGVAKTGLYPPMGFAAGGVARGPRAGYPAILHGNEAVVPLPNGKDIPVTFPKGAGAAGGMQTNNVGVTINMDGEGGSTTETDGDSQQMEALGEKLAAMIQEELMDQKRNGGLLSPYGVG